jgi:hypothetical protein
MDGGIRFVFFVVLALVGCAPAPFSRTQQAPKAISAEELKALIDKKVKFFFLDVREPAEIQALGTMKGYVNIPLSRLGARLSEIPKNTLVVTG